MGRPSAAAVSATPAMRPADALDLIHRNGGVRHHALDDLHGVAPAQIAGKMHGPTICCRRRAVILGHSLGSSLANTCGSTIWIRRRSDQTWRDNCAHHGETHARLLFPAPYWRYPDASGLASERGRSSVVERQLPKLYVVGSIPIARSNRFNHLGQT